MVVGQLQVIPFTSQGLYSVPWFCLHALWWSVPLHICVHNYRTQVEVDCIGSRFCLFRDVTSEAFCIMTSIKAVVQFFCFLLKATAAVIPRRLWSACQRCSDHVPYPWHPCSWAVHLRAVMSMQWPMMSRPHSQMTGGDCRDGRHWNGSELKGQYGFYYCNRSLKLKN